MKKRARRCPDSPFHIACPFCGFYCTRDTVYSWCARCYVEYYVTKRGAVVFDDQMRQEKFFWAKAIQKGGGMRFGNFKAGQEDDAR